MCIKIVCTSHEWVSCLQSSVREEFSSAVFLGNDSIDIGLEGVDDDDNDDFEFPFLPISLTFYSYALSGVVVAVGFGFQRVMIVVSSSSRLPAFVVNK